MARSVVKKSAERFRQIVDFAEALPAGQSVSACVVRAYDTLTGRDVTGGMIERPEVVGGRAVRFVVKGGASGSEYVFRVEATAGDEVLVEDVTLKVDRDPWDATKPELSEVASVVEDGAAAIARAGVPDLSDLSKAERTEPSVDAALPVGGSDGFAPVDDAPEIAPRVKDGEMEVVKYGTSEGAIAGHATQGHNVGGGGGGKSVELKSRFDSIRGRYRQSNNKPDAALKNEVRQLVSDVKQGIVGMEREVMGEVADAVKELDKAPGGHGANLQVRSERAIRQMYEWAADPKLADAARSGKIGTNFGSASYVISSILNTPSSIRSDIQRARRDAGMSKSMRTRAGAFAHERNATTTTELQVRAYGSGPDDRRVFRASAAGLPVASCPDGACAPADGKGGKPVDVDLSEVALGKRVLRRGKMSRMAESMRDGLKPDSPFVFAELDAAERERVGKKYGVVDGNHRVAHLMLSGSKAKVPGVIVPRKSVAKHGDHDQSTHAGDGGGGTPTPSADEQRAAFRQKIGEAARAEFGTDKPSRGQVQDRSQDQKAKYGKDARVWVWDPQSGSAMPGTVERDAKSDAYDKSGQREDRQYVVQVPDIDKGGTRPVTAYHGDIAPRGVKKQLSTSTPTKGAEWTPADIAGRRAKVRATAKEKRRAINA